MTKAERKELRAMQNMTCFRDEALLKMPHALDALDDKDALIAELIHYIDRIQWTDAEAKNIAALKARAGK